MIKVDIDNRVRNLFYPYKKNMVKYGLTSNIGKVFVDNEKDIKSSIYVVGNFIYLTGQTNINFMEESYFN